MIDAVEIDYTNWRGERSLRRVSVTGLYWGSSKWHPEPQWLLLAVDLEKGEARSFAMSGIHGWRAAP